MKKFKARMLLKPYFFIPLIIIFVVVLSFALWQILPSKKLKVVVVDKTVPATAADNASYLNDVSNNYRKHIGLFWLMNYMKIKNPDTGKPYNASKDYFGPKLDGNNKITESNTIADLTNIPDVLYLADSYGVEIYDDHGISAEEMNAVSMCHTAGSVVIGEQDILTSQTDENVKSQLEGLFGMTTTGWVGRYIFDLQDMTDVPYWAPSMWEQKYGQEWTCSGPGILLVSADGNIIVLEEKTDFQSKNLIKISVSKKFRREFGKKSMNYYNWFELIEAEYGTDTIANYTFNVNASGSKKMAEVSDTLTFAAVTRKSVKGQADTYYFAGDFNDYVTKQQIHKFCFADMFFKAFSFDRDGDVTNFYWNFYEPMMKKILNSACKNKVEHKESKEKSDIRVSKSGLFEKRSGKEWQTFELKGFNINGEMPGDKKYEYSDDYNSYVSLIKSVSEMKGNCIRTYDLLPPEFYRALYENNKGSDNPVYLIQGILTPTDINPVESIDKIDKIKGNIDSVLKAVHGDGIVEAAGKREETAYTYDVSDYVISYIIDPRISTEASDGIMSGSNSSYTYKGKYISGERNAVEALFAGLCDYTLSKLNEKYDCFKPVSICCNADRLEGSFWMEGKPYSYNLSKLDITDEAAPYFYVSYSLNTEDDILLNNTSQFESYTDVSGAFAYGGYIRYVKNLVQKPILIDRVGLSTNTNMFDKNKQINGLSETEQGNGIVRILRTTRAEGFLGALISDLNDNWSGDGEELKPFTVPTENSRLWQNTADRAENTGIVAVDSVAPKEVSMELNDSGAMQQMQLSSDENYVYVTVLLKDEINYDNSELILGIDTYQRNNGEYFYDKAYYANSLSGMEYIVKFESKKSAALYVASSYNRNTGNYSSSESYSAAYDFVSQLNYGDFSSSNTHFYQTGLTVRMRIPWAVLNFTDPSSKIVVNGFENGVAKTTVTDGMIFSLLIGEKNTMDTAYIFPSSKQQAGFKSLKIKGWDKEDIEYVLRQKASAGILKRYFISFE